MKYKKVAVGGTFDKFHKGHKSLLERAFEVGFYVVVGITSDEFRKNKGNIEPYHVRNANLKRFLEKFDKNYDVIKLNNRYGPTIHDETFDAIVVSRATKPTADKINRIRKDKGMNPLEIITIDMVLAENGKLISSTRIRNGEIDDEGRILR